MFDKVNPSARLSLILALGASLGAAAPAPVQTTPAAGPVTRLAANATPKADALHTVLQKPAPVSGQDNKDFASAIGF